MQAYLVLSLPYSERTASDHFGTFSVAKLKCLSRHAAWSNPAGTEPSALRYKEMGSY